MSILLEEIPDYYDESHLRKIFQKYGSCSITFSKSEGGSSALVVYSYTNEANNAYIDLKNKLFNFKMISQFKVNYNIEDNIQRDVNFPIKAKYKGQSVKHFTSAKKTPLSTEQYRNRFPIHSEEIQNEESKDEEYSFNSVNDIPNEDDICQFILENPPNY